MSMKPSITQPRASGLVHPCGHARASDSPSAGAGTVSGGERRSVSGRVDRRIIGSSSASGVSPIPAATRLPVPIPRRTSALTNSAASTAAMTSPNQ